MAKLVEFAKYYANQGDASAMDWLGYLYENGRGVTQNYNTAKYWYEKAAEKGHASVMCHIGQLF